MSRFHASLFAAGGLAVLTLALGCAEARADGASLYAKRCASCHGADGKADTPVGRALEIPSFAGKRHSRDAVAKVLAESESHKSLDVPLTEAELDALVAHLDSLAD